MRRSLSDRFPTVAKLLGGAAFVDDSTAPKPGDDGEGDDGTSEDEDGEGDGEGQPKPAPTDTPQVDGYEAGNEGGAHAAPAANAPASAAILAGFERDADALLAAEQQRCITVFTSPEGRRNPDAAAELVVEDLSAEKIISILGKTGGTARSSARERLAGSADVKPVTGGGTDAAAGTVDDVKAQQKAKREKRNAAALAKGGKKVNAETGD